VLMYCGGSGFISSYTKPNYVSPSLHKKINVEPGDTEILRELISVLRPLAQFERKSQSGDMSLAESIFGLLTTCLTYGGSDVILVNSKLEFLPSEAVPKSNLQPDSILLWDALGRELCSLLEELDDEVIISILLDPFVRENVKIIGKSSLPHVEIVKPYCEKIVRRFEKVEPVILQRMKLVSDAKKSVSDTSVVQNQVDRGFQSDGASILSLLFKELQKPETTTCLGEWNQFLSAQVEEIPDLVFWRRYCDQFPSIFHVWLQSRSARSSSAQLEGMFSTLTKIVPQDRESTSQRIQDCLLRVKTTQLTHPELNAFLETHVTEVGRPKGDSKINLEIKD